MHRQCIIQVAGNTTYGKVIPLPGHINAVAIDEARGLIYAGNFSAGRVEVVSMATHQRVSSFSTTPQPAAMVGMDMSLDSRFLVTLNAPVTSGVAQLSGVTAVNLNDPSDRRHYPMIETPVAITFQSNGEAFIITTGGIVLFDPDDGSFRPLVDFAAIDGIEGGADISLPVPPPDVSSRGGDGDRGQQCYWHLDFRGDGHIRLFLSSRLSRRPDGDSSQ